MTYLQIDRQSFDKISESLGLEKGITWQAYSQAGKVVRHDADMKDLTHIFIAELEMFRRLQKQSNFAVIRPKTSSYTAAEKVAANVLEYQEAYEIDEYTEACRLYLKTSLHFLKDTNYQPAKLVANHDRIFDKTGIEEKVRRFEDQKELANVARYWLFDVLEITDKQTANKLYKVELGAQLIDLMNYCDIERYSVYKYMDYGAALYEGFVEKDELTVNHLLSDFCKTGLIKKQKYIMKINI